MLLPTCRMYQALNELIFASDEIHHAALGMTDQSNAADSTDSDCIGDFEFAISQICTTRTNNECEIVRNSKMFSIVHTHSDQQAGISVRIEITLDVVKFEQPPDGGPLIL